MGLTAEQINAGLDEVAAREPAIARALRLAGYPPPRIRDRGYTTLLRTIVGQQVSVAAATSVWNKLEASLGQIAPQAVLAADFDTLRACGLSRQKQGYARRCPNWSLAASSISKPCRTTTRKRSSN